MAKVCADCKIEKSASEFYSRKLSKDGLHSYCKCCVLTRQKRYREEHPDREAKKQLDKRLRNKRDWVIFFAKHYGEFPKCEVCEIKLKWHDAKRSSPRDAKDTVRWDHCSPGSTKLSIPPSMWIRQNSCSTENQKKWLAFDLGILCNTCNKSLPTENRTEWLQQALRYTEGKIVGSENNVSWT